MNIMMVNAGRKNGNSSYIIKECVEMANNYPISVSPVHLGSRQILFCDGCLSCDEAGKCHIEDDMSVLIETVLASDAFLFVSPTRWSLLSGELKTFIDRLNPLAASEKLSGKSAAIICLGQSEFSDDDSINLAAQSISHFCENAGINVVGMMGIEKCLNETDIIPMSQDLQKCKDLFLTLIKSEG